MKRESRAVFAGAVLGCNLIVGKAWAQKTAPASVNVDSNTIVLDLDRQSVYTYKSKMLANIPIGSSPGQISLGSSIESFPINHELAVDVKDQNLFIDDGFNHRIEQFSLSPFKFQKEVFQYSGQEIVSGLAIDQNEHLFVWVSQNNPWKSLGLWEIFQGRTLRKIQSSGNPVVLGDGRIWLTTPIKDSQTITEYSSLDGSKKFIYDQNGASTWPLRSGMMRINNLTPNEKLVIILDVDGKEKKGVRFKSPHPIQYFQPRFIGEDDIFFSIAIKKGAYISALSLRDMSIKVTKFNLNDRASYLDALAANGDLYFYQSKDRANDLTFRVFRSTPTKMP